MSDKEENILSEVPKRSLAPAPDGMRGEEFFAAGKRRVR